MAMIEQSGESIDKLYDMIRDIRVAMMTTQAVEGCMRSRPMVTQQTHNSGELWFITREETTKTGEIELNPHVNLSYSDPDDNRFVSVCGTATLSRDRAKAKEIWNPLHKLWFPEGPDDPGLVLIRVQVHGAEYWDAPSNRMQMVPGMIKAAMEGEVYAPGENRELKV